MSGHFDIRGERIGYTITGEGPTVVQAHGLSQSRGTEARVGLGDFAPVAATHRVVSYDARGHGSSTGRRVPADYTWPELARDLLAIADHVSPDRPVSGIGTSMGTGTLLHAVTQRPDRFDRLVLTAPPTAWETRAAQAAGYAQIADVVEQGGPDAVSSLFAALPPAPIFDGREGLPMQPDVMPALLPSILRGAGLSDLPDADVLSRVTAPTLILAWDTDPGHPLSTAAELVRLLPNARLSVAHEFEDISTWGAQAAHFLAAQPR